jgi:hypothetical protein
LTRWVYGRAIVFLSVAVSMSHIMTEGLPTVK